MDDPSLSDFFFDSSCGKFHIISKSVEGDLLNSTLRKVFFHELHLLHKPSEGYRNFEDSTFPNKFTSSNRTLPEIRFENEAKWFEDKRSQRELLRNFATVLVSTQNLRRILPHQTHLLTYYGIRPSMSFVIITVALELSPSTSVTL